MCAHTRVVLGSMIEWRDCRGNSISAVSIMPIGDQVRPVRSDVGRAVGARLSTNAAMINSSIAIGPKGAA